MNIHHIRNATAILDYGGKILIDPMLAEKEHFHHLFRKVLSITKKDQMNPLVDLPMPVEDIINGIDAVIVTHLHLDHWDDIAKEVLPKEINYLCKMKMMRMKFDYMVLKCGGTTRRHSFESIQLVKQRQTWQRRNLELCR